MVSTIQYYSNINSYKCPPQYTCTLKELETICIERLQLYRIFVEAEYMKLKPHTNTWKKYVFDTTHINSLKTYEILLSHDNVDTFQARKQDHIAHWILSLCYCNNMDLRNYFIDWELTWIALVYELNTEASKKKFLKTQKLDYQKVSTEEKERLQENLISCRKVENFDTAKYYKTRFINILPLVHEREIYVSKGCAYFPETDLIHLLKCKLNAQFKEQLEWNFKMLPNVTKEDRIQHFLKSLPIVLPRLTVFNSLSITLDDLEEISKYHYPLCMRHIHKMLKMCHHLKHDCRMQYGIFLKNLGLPYDDAMQFFEQEFTQSMSKNWFVRKYAYYFKHYYGKVGGRLDYKPYSCKSIQTMTPGPVQHHGCPFKHWDKETLIDEIAKDGLSSTDIRDIEDLIFEKNYQNACTKYYCVTKKVFRNEIIDSPNQYCAESFNLEMSLDNLLDSILLL